MRCPQSFLTRFPDTGFHSPDEPWIVKLLADLVDPEDIFQKPGYTQSDLLAYLTQLYRQGAAQFFGSKTAGILFRTYMPNPYVVEPHILGNGKYYIPLMRCGIDFLFKTTKVQKINIYTHLPSSRNIASRHGFTLEGTLTNSYLHRGSLVDVYILGLHKNDYQH